MKHKSKTKSVLSALLSAVMLLGSFTVVTFAAQSNEYVDPADHWLSSNGRTNELDMNAKHTRYYIDEFHLLLKEKQTAEYSVEIWKRFRKWGGIPTGITQNIRDFLRSDEIENIFENSDFVYLLSQGHDDRNLLAQKLCISPEQLSYVKDSAPGCGLLCCRNVIIPFEDKFPKDTKLYSLMTTKLEEVVKNE